MDKERAGESEIRQLWGIIVPFGKSGSFLSFWVTGRASCPIFLSVRSAFHPPQSCNDGPADHGAITHQPSMI